MATRVSVGADPAREPIEGLSWGLIVGAVGAADGAWVCLDADGAVPAWVGDADSLFTTIGGQGRYRW